MPEMPPQAGLWVTLGQFVEPGSRFISKPTKRHAAHRFAVRRLVAHLL